MEVVAVVQDIAGGVTVGRGVVVVKLDVGVIVGVEHATAGAASRVSALAVQEAAKLDAASFAVPDAAANDNQNDGTKGDRDANVETSTTGS